MPPDPVTDRKARRALGGARLAACCFGAALLAWGIWPAVLFRVTTGDAPPPAALAAGGSTLAVGLIFIGLGILMGRGVGWALWAALLCSVGLLAASAALHLLGRMSAPALFPLLLALATTATSGLALVSRRGRERPRALPAARP